MPKTLLENEVFENAKIKKRSNSIPFFVLVCSVICCVCVNHICKKQKSIISYTTLPT
jgi:hypothetical protein